jgi:hypothetical protein
MQAKKDHNNISMNKKDKNRKTQPVSSQKKSPQDKVIHNSNHKRDFNNLLDDAVLGVKKK